MMRKIENKNTYKVQVKIVRRIICRKITNDLDKLLEEIKLEYPNAHISQVGRRTTLKAATKWLDMGGKRQYMKYISIIRIE